jgi:hypothetical protein
VIPLVVLESSTTLERVAEGLLPRAHSRAL